MEDIATIIDDRLAECADYQADEDEAHNLGDCVIDALAIAGHAIVTLPQPHYGVSGATWDIKGWGVELDGRSIYLARIPIDSIRARELGLALVAAANASEALS
jgi:hypothetical protein